MMAMVTTMGMSRSLMSKCLRYRIQLLDFVATALA
jgi:hypothetical protein